METNVTKPTIQKNVAKRLCIWALIIITVLLVPLLANAPWTVGDFIFAAAVLSLCATVYELATRNTTSIKQRLVVGAAVLFFIFLVIGWAAAGP